MAHEVFTLTELVQKADAALRVYDLGRRLSLLSADQFLRVEQLQTPYPHPYLHHAWVALTLWNPKNKKQNAVWFLKLPLDEQGYLIPAVRDDLINRLMQNIQSSQQGIPQDDSLRDNPFMFKPAPEKMAVFHALASRDAGAKPSIHFEAVEHYLHKMPQKDGWQELTLQGLADYVIWADKEANQHYLSQALPHMAEGLAAQVLALIEHIRPGQQLTRVLANLIDSELDSDQPDPVKLSLLVRALSSSRETSQASEVVRSVLINDVAEDIELLSALATRCEQLLMDTALLTQFLERLARSSAGQQGFSRVLAELMFLPVHRVLIVQILRAQSVSESLKAATDEMFGAHFRAAGRGA